MSPNQQGALLALGANLCFALSSIFFTRFSKALGSVWMNTFKSLIAFIAFTTCHFLFISHSLPVFDSHYLYFIISGFIGLGIGDIFLIKAFVDLGPAKTLVLFAFQPMIFLLIDSSVFGLSISLNNIIAISIFILCVILFSVENMNQNNSWNFKGLIYAFLGILLDGTGTFLTKKGFIHFPEIDGLSANAIRCLGALVFYIIVNFFFPIQLFSRLKSLPGSIRYQPFLFSFTGTFVSLFFYLNALKLGALSIITGIAVTGPIFSTIFEGVFESRKPTKIHMLALFLFIFAFYLNFKS